MRLRKLAIHALPGIEPGFTFEPPSAGINVVTGPNAVGKSSLARALKYLLASHASDPPALSLEAELESSGARWQVGRNGNQIVWRSNGEVVSRPALPGADQFGLFRLSVEHLLDDDDPNDKALARRLRDELHGNIDLNEPRIELTRRFARHEADVLIRAGRERRRVENEYIELQRSESELPELERRIEQSVAARARREHLERALGLVDAIDARKAREAALLGFPPDMDRLRGDELGRLDEMGDRARALNEELRARRHDLEAAKTDLERTGLALAPPAPQDVQAAEERLRLLGEQGIERENVLAAWTEAGAELRDATLQFNDDGQRPRLEAGTVRRAEGIALPLIAAQARRRELTEQLTLAGEAPRAAEIERQRHGAEALRSWLAATAAASAPARASTKLPWIVSWVALLAAAFAALAAYVAGAIVALAGAVVSLLALGAALLVQRARQAASPRPTEEAVRRFGETGLPPPPRWDEHGVRRHLHNEIEARLNALTLQQARAAEAERIALQIREADETIETLEARRVALARELGFDPRLPAAELQRFAHLCAEWDRARTRQVRQGARFELLDREIAEGARLVGDFLDRWRVADAPGPDDSEERPDPVSLRSALEALKRRIDLAGEARHRIRSRETEVRSLTLRIAENDEAVESLFTQAGIGSRDRTALAGRIERLAQWKQARDALQRAGTEEALIRGRLADRPDLVALAEGGKRARLQAELAASAREADEHTRLIEERATIETRLNDAGRDRKLEQTAAEEDRARQALEDKRDDALLAVATKTLLDDVERTFVAEHEPAVLRRARDLFAEVTAHAFDLRLRGDGTFIAHDVRQDAARALSELSSGTRMQLLLALRMAWIEAREQGGETLPLFLDEALTTSDEARFAVMAQSLERLAGDQDRDAGASAGGPGGGAVEEIAFEAGAGSGDGAGDGDAGGAAVRASGRGGDGAGAEDGTRGGTGAGRSRQIFYLSARRHEPALWQQATGTRPAVIDLASIRFPSHGFAPEDYRVEAPPSLPAPDGRSAEEYASLLGVPPRLDPHRPPGGIHVFHLLRDDLTLLHDLMDTWRIASLGQLEDLLASDAARAALPTEDLRRRLRQRCRIVRTWVELWRRGRGRPVDRGVLERCAAVSTTYIDRVADLAARSRGDGEALVQALRAGELDRFRSRKVDALEQWLIDEGYTDNRRRLAGEDRRRLTAQRAAPGTAVDAVDVNRVVSWLEASAADGESAGDREGPSSDEGFGIERVPA